MSVDDEFDDPTETASLDVGSHLSNGLDSLLSMTGGQLVALLALFGIVGSLLVESLVVRIGRDGLEYIRENFDTSEPEVREAVIEIERALEDMGFGLDIPIPVALLGLLVLALLGEAIRIVAVRAFASGELDGVATELATRRLPIATLYGFLGGILLSIAVGIGTLLFVVPGLFIFIGTLFFRQEIAIADKGPLQAISGTWQLTKGNRWTLLLLVIVLWAIGFAVGLVPGVVPGRVGTVLSTVVTSVITVFSIGVVTDAYVTLRDSPTEDDQPPEADQPTI
jgi:hypothetical protein